MSIGQVKLGGIVDPRLAYGSPSVEKSGSVRRDGAVESMVSGEIGEVHDVMIAAEEAQLSFELMLEVRNKLLESYQQIMQMQV